GVSPCPVDGYFLWPGLLRAVATGLCGPSARCAFLSSLVGVLWALCESGAVICGSRGATCAGCDSLRSGIAGVINSETDIATASRRIISSEMLRIVVVVGSLPCRLSYWEAK